MQQIETMTPGIWSSLVHYVAFPDPPGFCYGNFTSHPHFWDSKVVDKLAGMQFVGLSSTVIKAAWDDDGGPIILCVAPLSSVIESCFGKMKFAASTICAGIEYNPKTVDDIEVCNETIITELELITGCGGCNPSGCLFYPDAPDFSRALANHRAESIENDTWSDSDPVKDLLLFRNRPKITEKKVCQHFGDFDFSGNAILDSIYNSKFSDNKEVLTFETIRHQTRELVVLH